MGVVEQERALMLEQQQLDKIPTKKQHVTADALEKVNIADTDIPMKEAEEAKAERRDSECCSSGSGSGHQGRKFYFDSLVSYH